MIDSGKLRSRIEIVDHELNSVCEVWADVRPITTREMLRSQVEITTDTYTIQIRFRHGLNSTMKVRYKSIIYDIIGITDSYADDSIVLTVEMSNLNNDRIRNT